MDPLSALIGGGISAISGLLGGQMNASSQQAINAANLQQQMWSAEGGYLPGLVANAGKAGLNPLAVLGSRGPNMAVQVGTSPGAGLQAAGVAAGNAISRIDMESRELELQKKREEVQQAMDINLNTKIRNEVDTEVRNRLFANKSLIPAGWQQPAEETSVQGAALKGASNIWEGLNRGADYIFGKPPVTFDEWRQRAQRSIMIPPMFRY